MLKRIFLIWLVALTWSGATAQPVVIETELKPVIDKLARTASSQQFSQIIGAARASPQLARQLARLVAQGKLTEIRIAATKGSKPFRAWVEGSTIFFIADFLAAQLDNRGVAIHAGDILPNNTVYCLGHLAYHLATGIPEPRNYPRLEEFVRKNLELEAAAYIQGFNDVIDAAMQSNGGNTLTERQALPILLNRRYQNALGKAKLTPTGTIEPNAQNIAAVVGALRNSPITDLE